MGVIYCSRNECNHIMCDRMILNGTLYICNECYGELLLYKTTWPNFMTKREVKINIEHFMSDTSPGEFIYVGKEDINDEFKRLTCDEDRD